jgi:hypothetical protein
MTRLLIGRAAKATAIGLLTTGGVLLGGGVASATFPGANDAITFYSSCGSIQAIYSVPNGTTISECPPGNPASGPPYTNPPYTQSTSASIDAMPFFSSDGGTLYFESNRASFGAPWSIYSVATRRHLAARLNFWLPHRPATTTSRRRSRPTAAVARHSTSCNAWVPLTAHSRRRRSPRLAFPPQGASNRSRPAAARLP